MFEVRVVVGRDPATGRSVQRSFTVRGDVEQVQARRRELVADYGVAVPVWHASAVTVAELLRRWILAGRLGWKPSTVVGYRCTARFLEADPIGSVRLGAVDPAALRRAICRWRAAGAGVAVVSGRSKVLCAALTFAVEQGLVRWHPLAGMRRPPQPLPRLPLPLDDVQLLLRTAAKLVADVEAAADTVGGRQRLFEAEQTQLLAHLAAYSAARRGELAALLAGDLAGRVLGIHQAISGLDTLTCPKTHQYRSMTLGSTTATLWHRHLHHFPVLEPGHDWLFAPDPDRATFIHPRGLAARFERLRGVAGVPHATLHRLRHTVAVILVAAGHVLAAQHRLGHRDASTTLRHYGWVLPPDDTAIADQLEVILAQRL